MKIPKIPKIFHWNSKGISYGLVTDYAGFHRNSIILQGLVFKCTYLGAQEELDVWYTLDHKNMILIIGVI